MLKSIEERYENAIEQMVPDRLDDILAQDIVPMQEEDEIVHQETNSKNKRRQGAYISVVGVAVAAMFLLFLYNKNLVETTITIDVNPSFEIQLNKEEEVKSVIGINEDGKKIVEQAEFKDKNLKHTVETLMQVVEKNGYFKKKSAVLVSVQNKEEEAAQGMEKKLKKQIKKTLESSETKPKVYAQLVRPDKEIEEVAKSYQISKGRATFICNMIKKDCEWKLEELGSMSIEELISCAKEKGVKVSEILEKQPKKEQAKKQKGTKQQRISTSSALPDKKEAGKDTKKEATKDKKSQTIGIKDTQKKKNKSDEIFQENKDKNKEPKGNTGQSDSENRKDENFKEDKNRKKEKEKHKGKEQEETPRPTQIEPSITEMPENTEVPDPHGNHGGGKPGKGGR